MDFSSPYPQSKTPKEEIKKKEVGWTDILAGVGLEPTTFRLWAWQSSIDIPYDD